MQGQSVAVPFHQLRQQGGSGAAAAAAPPQAAVALMSGGCGGQQPPLFLDLHVLFNDAVVNTTSMP